MDGLAQAARADVFSLLFVLFGPSVDWMMWTAIASVISFAQSTNSSANLSGNPFTDTPRET